MTESNLPEPAKTSGLKFDQSNWVHVIVAGVAATLLGALVLAIAADLFVAVTNTSQHVGLTPGSWFAKTLDAAKTALLICFLAALVFQFRRGSVGRGDAAAVARLRARLAAGEGVGQIYERIVGRAILLTDRFFGDAGKADESWKPKAFGLREGAPLWTAASYDRCLQIALIYPLLCIILVWAGWNDAGEAGAALGLIKTGDGARWGATLALGASVLCFFKAERVGGGQELLLIFGAIVFALAGAFAIDFSGVILIASIFGIAAASIGAVAVAGAVGFAMIVAGVGVGVGVVVGAVTLGVVYLLLISARLGWLPHFFWLFTFVMLPLCLLLPSAAGMTPDWRKAGAFLYVLPLLTLVNAPFDWAALGITRALLRKGLEQRGGWPLVWGAVDLLISLATVALLAIVVLIITQLFNAVATYGGAREMVFDPLLALRDLAQPELRNQPKYYWLYFMLLTTQIPAILNLGAGFFCVVRSYDFGNGLIRRLIGDAPVVDLRARLAIAALQAAQFALAFTAGGLLFYALFTGFISVELPAGGGLIDLLLWIANANWPAQWLGVAG